MGVNMKKSLSILLVLVAFGLNTHAFANQDPSKHVYAKDSCIENVEDVIVLASDQGMVYENSGSPDVLPPNANQLDELYYLNYLDTVAMYAADSTDSDSEPKVIERNNRINQAIFEAVGIGRSLVNGSRVNYTSLEDIKRSLKNDCLE